MMYIQRRRHHIPFRQFVLAALRLGALALLFVTCSTAATAAFAPSPSSDSDSTSLTTNSLPTPSPRYSIELAKTAPRSRTIKVGGAVSFEAAVYAGGKRLNDEDLIFHWAAAKDVRFISPDGPSATTAIFMGWGERQVEVSCTRRIGRSLVDIGRSSPIAVNVAKPHVSLRITPSEPMVGEKVTAKFSLDSDLDALRLMWKPLPTNARLVDVGPKEISFYLMNDKPVTVSVVPRYDNPGNVPTEALDEATVDINAKSYDVTIKNIGAESAPARIWRDGVGPVEVSRELAVNQGVRLRADVSPTPRSAHLRYVWTLEEDGRLDSNASSREKVVTKPSIGPLVAHVEIRDSRDILLGHGQETISFTISQRDIDQVDVNMKRTKELLTEAQNAWGAGDIDAACLATERAVQLYPSFEPALSLKKQYISDRDIVADHLERARNLIEQNTFDQATPHLEAAAKIAPAQPDIQRLYSLMDQRKSDLKRVVALLTEAQSRQKQGRMDAALVTINDALLIDPGNAEALSLRNTLVKKRQQAVDLMREASAMADEGKLEQAKVIVEKGEKTFPNFAPLQELGRDIAERQEKALTLGRLVAEAKTAWSNGDIDAALTATSNALAMRPDWNTAAELQQSIIDKREAIIRVMDDANQLLDADAFDQAKTALAGARHINENYPPIAELEKRIDAARKQAEAKTERYLKSARQLVDNNRFEAALAILRELNQDSLYTNTQKTQAEALFLAAQSGKSKLDSANAHAPGITRAANRENSPLERVCLTRFHRAYAEQKNNHYSEAIAEYTDIIEQCPTLCDAMNNIGVSYNQLGQIADALPWYEKAVTCNPRNTIYSDNAEGARKWLSTSTRPSKHAATESQCKELFRQARGLQSKGEHLAAIDVFKNILAACTPNCKAINDVGVSLYALGHVKESIRWFEHASKCDPANTLFKDNTRLTKKQIQDTERQRKSEHRYVKAGLE
ncbi:tetratricopeptide repeat protein [Desulfovibrio inopinatus]|uniref:tetratricopeptide repeat protein n=1 Tax=Desulfovibrio inopinatus TaxID=102109 RepID=UPI000412C6F8|nr:tetratricopeptide repeat protein [Desulfovibrio inopinatus]